MRAGCPEDSPSLGQRGSGTSGMPGARVLHRHPRRNLSNPGADANSLCWRWKPDGARHCATAVRPCRELRRARGLLLLLRSGSPAGPQGPLEGTGWGVTLPRAGRAGGEVTTHSGVGPVAARSKASPGAPGFGSGFISQSCIPGAALKVSLTRREKIPQDRAGIWIWIWWGCVVQSGMVLEIPSCRGAPKLHFSARICFLCCCPGQNWLRVPKPWEKRSLSFLVAAGHRHTGALAEIKPCLRTVIALCRAGRAPRGSAAPA